MRKENIMGNACSHTVGIQIRTPHDHVYKCENVCLCEGFCLSPGRSSGLIKKTMSMVVGANCW